MPDTNKRVDVRFFNQQLELIGDIDDYTALTYTRKWTTYNTFEMHVSKFDGELIRRGNFIMLNSDRYRSGIITYFEDNERETNDITIRGFCPRFLLFERPTIPPNGQDYDTYNTEVENILIGLIDRNCVNPENGNRKIPFLSCAKSQNRGEKTSFQTAHKVLKDEISSLCTASNLGTATYFDPTTKQIRFEVLSGTDRTYDNSVHPPYVFARKWDRLFERNYTESDTDYKNVAYVAGQGEGKDREILTIGDDVIGFERREVFVDARDIGEDAETTLEDRGKLKLAEYALIKSFESTVKTDDYRAEWDLGDFVTIEDDKTGIREDRQILEVKEVYETENYSIEPVMGEPLKTPQTILKRNAASPVSYQGKQGEPGENGKTPNFRLDEDGNLYAVYE